MSKPAIGVERFIIREKHEWAFVYVDEKTGVFSSYSSFGNYTNCWTAIGKQSLKQFLLDLDFDYFMLKTVGLGYRQFDAHETVKGIRQYIIERRREGWLTAVSAREAWNCLIDFSPGMNSHEFFEEFCNADPLMTLYGSDYYEVAREAPTGNAKGFWEIIWPALLIQLRDALTHQI